MAHIGHEPAIHVGGPDRGVHANYESVPHAAKLEERKAYSEGWRPHRARTRHPRRRFRQRRPRQLRVRPPRRKVGGAEGTFRGMAATSGTNPPSMSEVQAEASTSITSPP